LRRLTNTRSSLEQVADSPRRRPVVRVVVRVVATLVVFFVPTPNVQRQSEADAQAWFDTNVKPNLPPEIKPERKYFQLDNVVTK